MAGETVKSRRGSAATGVDAGVETSSEGIRPANAPSFIDLMNQNLDTPTHLNGDALKYIEDVKTYLDKEGFACEYIRVQGSNYEARVVVRNKHGIALVFQDSYQNTQNVPVAAFYEEMCQKARTQISDIVIDECIVVRKGMYNRAEKMGSFIKNCINSIINPELGNVTAAYFTNQKFVASRDINAVRAFIDSRSPHDVPARDDIGVILYAVREKPNQSGFGGRPEEERIPVLAITGYTEFFVAPNVSMNGIMNMQLGGIKYAAVTTLTDIVSDLKSGAMAATGIAIALDAFIRQGAWLDQFNHYSKNEPNIGRLINGEDGRPWLAANQQQRNEFIQNYLVSSVPFLAIDVQNGRARIPALEDLVRNQPNFVAAMQRFTNAGRNYDAPTLQQFRYFSGTVTVTNQEVVDSRCIDYLRLAASIPQTDTLSAFLQQSMDPRQSLENIKKQYPQSTESLYVTHRVLLRPDFVTAVATDLAQSLRLGYDFINNDACFNFAQILTAQGNQFNNFGGLAVGAGNNGGWNPMMGGF